MFESKIGEAFSDRVCYAEAADARVDALVPETFDQHWEDDRRDARARASSQRHEEQKHDHYR